MRDERSPLWALLRHRNTRKYCVYTVGVGVSAYLGYSLYRKDSYLSHLRGSLKKYTSAVDKGGDILHKLLSDLYAYVLDEEGDSDGDEARGGEGAENNGGARAVPESLRNVARLVESEEFRLATKNTVRAIVEGLIHVDENGSEEGEMRPEHKTSPLDKVLGALLSERGSTLASLALSMAAKNVVSAYVESTRSVYGAGEPGPRLDEKLFTFLSDPRGQELAIRCISACADSAMLAYTQETKNVNYYDQMLDAVVKSKDHSNLVMDCISLSIRAAVSAWNASEEDLVAAEENLVNELQDLEVDDLAPKGRPADEDSPVSALRPLLSSVATPASSIGSGRMSQVPVTLRRRRNGTTNTHRKPNHNEGFLRALSKEFIQVSKDEHGREAIAQVFGSVTKEAVGAVANTVADRLDAAYFLSVLLLGALLSIITNLVLKSLFSSVEFFGHRP